MSITYDDEAVAAKKAEFRADWTQYMVQALGIKEEFIWDKMREIITALQIKRKVAVKAGNSVSKTFTAAAIANCFHDCYGPNCSVIYTAPTAKHVEDVLGAEIRNQRINAKVHLGGEVGITDIRHKGFPKWLYTGFTVRPDNITQQAAAMQGYHNKYVLVIFDEASGIAPQIWAAAERLMTNERCYWLVIGNPPISGLGEFVSCFEPDSGWEQITISVLDTPNYKEGREVIPGVSGQLFEQEMAEKYSKESPRYLANVLGEIPYATEGTVYGELIGEAMRSGRIKDFNVDRAVPVHTFRDLGPMHNAVIYAQFIGDNEIYLIDYFEDHKGAGVSAQTEAQKAKPFEFGSHWTGWDVAKPEDGKPAGPNAKDMRGEYILDLFKKEGIPLNALPKYGFLDGILAVKQLFPKFVIHKTACAGLIAAFRHYKMHKVERGSVEGKPVYGTEEEKSWATHGIAAMRCLAMVWFNHRMDMHKCVYPSFTSQESFLDRRDENAICRPGAVDDESDMFASEREGVYTI